MLTLLILSFFMRSPPIDDPDMHPFRYEPPFFGASHDPPPYTLNLATISFSRAAILASSWALALVCVAPEATCWDAVLTPWMFFET